MKKILYTNFQNIDDLISELAQQRILNVQLRATIYINSGQKQQAQNLHKIQSLIQC
jgi:hypothetical protein